MSDLMIHVRFTYDYVSIGTCFYSSNVTMDDSLVDELDFDDEVIADEAAQHICDEITTSPQAHAELRNTLLLHANDMTVELP